MNLYINFIIDWMNIIINWIESHSGFVTFIFTLILTIANIMLWKATKRTADATKESVKLAKDSLLSTKRAFVFLDNITLKKVNWPKGLEGYHEFMRWMVEPLWKNSGDTPTKQLTVKVNHKKFYGEPDISEFDYECAKEISGSIGPKSQEIIGEFLLENAFVEELKTSKNPLYIWGEARYKDVFGQDHITRFCRKMIFAQQNIRGKEDIPTFFMHEHYNCFDDDCYD